MKLTKIKTMILMLLNIDSEPKEMSISYLVFLFVTITGPVVRQDCLLFTGYDTN